MATASSDEVKAAVKTVLQTALPSMLDPEASAVSEHLVDTIGCESTDDLVHLVETDLPMLKQMAVRKLLAYVKGNSHFPQSSFCLLPMLTVCVCIFAASQSATASPSCPATQESSSSIHTSKYCNYYSYLVSKLVWRMSIVNTLVWWKSDINVCHTIYQQIHSVVSKHIYLYMYRSLSYLFLAFGTPPSARCSLPSSPTTPSTETREYCVLIYMFNCILYTAFICCNLVNSLFSFHLFN